MSKNLSKRENGQAKLVLPSTLYTTEAVESKKKAVADLSVPDPKDEEDAKSLLKINEITNK